VEELLEAIVARIPPPRGDPAAPLRALIFDSWFDPYQGAAMLVRVKEGELERDTRIRLMSTGAEYEPSLVGVIAPEVTRVDRLACGEVGVILANIRDPRAVRIGDTVTRMPGPAAEPLPGFRPLKPMVWSGLYPADPGSYDSLRAAIEKLQLNDSSLSVEPETSEALGFGFRCGYLGLLHMEIVQERLEREYNLELIITAPTVVYRVRTRDGREEEIHRPSDLPVAGEIEEILEPRILAQIHLPTPYLGSIIQFCQDRRGVQRDLMVHSDRRAVLRYDLPLAEIVVDFYDRLKSATRGFASMDYDLLEYRRDDLVKLDILVGGNPVDALAIILHRDKAYRRGLAVLRQMRSHIPRQMFEVALQAAIGSRVIARETVKALRKNVTGKCYGGDVTRKRKLLEKQKEGKRRMKRVGNVEIPQEAFLAVLSTSDDES
jgi:GTP-binding protein LepA